MTIERKVLVLEQAAIDETTGRGSGYAAVFGNIDDGGDVILPGFFEPVLADFLREGFISWMHDWGVPVAYPIIAREDSKGLFIEWEYHSTPAAQEARAVASERLAAGKTMGLSIGYEVAEEEQTAKARLLRIAKRLFETGLVMVPMNRLATVTEAKSNPDSPALGDTEGDAPHKSALGSGLTYADRLALVTDEAKALVEHARNRQELRAKEGRVLSAANRDRLSTLSDSLTAVLSDISELLRDTEPKPKGKPAWVLSARARLAQAQAEHDINWRN